MTRQPNAHDDGGKGKGVVEIMVGLGGVLGKWAHETFEPSYGQTDATRFFKAYTLGRVWSPRAGAGGARVSDFLRDTIISHHI